MGKRSPKAKQTGGREARAPGAGKKDQKVTTARELEALVLALPIFDTHSHLSPIKGWAKPENRRFPAFRGYASADLIVAAGVLPPGVDAPLPETPVDAADRRAVVSWGQPLPAPGVPADPADPAYARRFFELWRAVRLTGYGRATALACRELLGCEFTEANVPRINAALEKLVGADPAASYRKVLRERAGIRWIIKDSVCKAADITDDYPPEFVLFNYRDDDLFCLRSREDVATRELRWRRSLNSVGDVVAGMNAEISACMATGRLAAFKLGMAYKRDLVVGEPTLHEAERAFGRLMNLAPGVTLDTKPGAVVRLFSRVAAEELRPLQDYLLHQYLRRILEENLPLQVHTGCLGGTRARLSDSRALDLLPLLIRYPRLRFDLFHAGWPWTEEHAALGKSFPNVWLNLCWAWALNPLTAQRTLASWLACVPYTKIFGCGGDTWHPVAEYGYVRQARLGVARTLSHLVAAGRLSVPEAADVARALLLENACAFYGREA